MRMRHLFLRRVDDENVALALNGVIKRDSFSVGRPFGRSVATARLGALLNTGPIRVHNVDFTREMGLRLSSEGLRERGIWHLRRGYGFQPG